MDATAEEMMVKASMTKHIVCGVLAAAGALAALQPAEALPARVRFTPPYGTPFNGLEWFGEAIVKDGTCSTSGQVSNIVGGCAGQFSFESATVHFVPVGTEDLWNPANWMQTLDFKGGQVIAVDRVGTDATDWREVISTPFNPVQGTSALTLYDPPGSQPAAQAYFSLVFIGGYAQLYWFQKEPGDPLLDPLIFPYVDFESAPYYLLCYKEGDNRVGGFFGIDRNRCGISSNVGGESGALSFTEVGPSEIPEPGTLALVLASGLGVAGLRLRPRGTKT